MKRVAVITGTTSGIGKAIAQYYKEEGFFVVGVNRRGLNLSEHPLDRNFVFNLSNEEETVVCTEQLRGQFEHIDVLVNNAGVMILNGFAEEDNGLTIMVDLHAPIIFCTHLLRLSLMIKGHIINIASVAGMTGDVDAPVYSACKAGIINLTRSLAKAYAPNIRVNCISPGFFNTNLVLGDTPQELIDQVPMKREAEPEEIIPVVDMLQKSTYITGANIVIDGGVSL